MATYATNTNPFIKNESTNAGLSVRCSMKAPGMAKPQNSINDCNKNGGPNLLLSDQDSGVISASSDISTCCQDEQLDTSSKNKRLDEDSLCLDLNQNVQSLPCTTKEDLSKIANNLVDIAIENELINSMSDNIIEAKEMEETNIENQLETDFKSLDNEDEVEEDDEAPRMETDSRKQQHIELIKKLRLQLRDLERYAYERGELEQVPQSVIAERQTVILDTLKDKLSLNICIDEIEKLELNELKKQVDKEVHDLLDPLITKEHLLGQLQTQLIDLERYISHLHGTLDRKSCQCHLHGCSSLSEETSNVDPTSSLSKGFSLMDNTSLPKTSKLIRSLVTQLICSDIKLQESAKKEKEFEGKLQSKARDEASKDNVSVKEPQYHDGAAWSLHLDKVILATDSLMNLFFLEPQYQRPKDKPVDKGLVESVVRRQLVPAIRDLLSYGLIDPNSTTRSTSYASLLFDPYYLLTSLTCFPSSQKTNNTTGRSSPQTDRLHVWNVIEDYYSSRNEPGFKNSSIKTLSQSFNLEPSMNGPIKITSKQALLIAVDDIVETLSKCKPDGPESHFRAFIYSALNRSKLATWLRLVFKNKSIARKYYHSFSFVCQSDKMDKFLKTIESLNQIEFNLSTDVESIEQFISAF